MQKDTLADKVICAIIVTAFIALATACNSEKRFNDYSIKNPDKFKKLAAILAPCINVKAKSDTIITTHLDTVYSAGETVITRVKDTIFVTRTLPAQIITKTKTLAIHDTVIDSRAMEVFARLKLEKSKPT